LSQTNRYVRIIIIIAVAILALAMRQSDASGTDSAEPAQARTVAQTFFPHSKPTHQKVDCAKCHTVTAAKIDENTFPDHPSCVGCHNLALEAIDRPVIFCGICHNGRPVSQNQPALFSYPKPGSPGDFGIDFSHPSHLKPFRAGTSAGIPAGNPTGGNPTTGNPTAGNPTMNSSGEIHAVAFVQRRSGTPTCFDCHKPVPRAGASPIQISTATGHPACFVCHGEKPIAQPGMFQCAGCHKLGGPKYPRLYGLVVDFRHSDHVYDTRPIIKGQVSFPRPSDYLCSECHKSAARAVQLNEIKLPQENYCTDCHNGNVGLPDPLSRKVLDSLGKR
jgi:hypothetical protein